MRILVGAGIGGMTFAALLDRRGVGTTLIECAPDSDHAGQMLGFWPLGYRVLLACRSMRDSWPNPSRGKTMKYTTKEVGS